MDAYTNHGELPDLTAHIIVLNYAPIFVGTYSHIYKGTCRGNIIAIKVLRSLSVSLHAMRRKVEREREVWARLKHPNIVPLLGYTEESELFGVFGALISPWFKRGDAGKFLQSYGNTMTLNERKRLYHGVVAGVCHLHNFIPVIIHGDLKPGNILIDDRGVARICDFGLVRIFLEDGHSGMTTTSEHTGTDRYLSYELVNYQDANYLTTASDIFALGCVGLDFLFLQPPYSHRRTNRFGLIFQNIRAGIPPAVRPPEPKPEQADLWAILEACWKLIPQDRMTAQWLKEELENVGSNTQTNGMQQMSQLLDTPNALNYLSNLHGSAVRKTAANYGPVSVPGAPEQSHPFFNDNTARQGSNKHTHSPSIPVDEDTDSLDDTQGISAWSWAEDQILTASRDTKVSGTTVLEEHGQRENTIIVPTTRSSFPSPPWRHNTFSLAINPHPVAQNHNKASVIHTEYGATPTRISSHSSRRPINLTTKLDDIGVDDDGTQSLQQGGSYVDPSTPVNTRRTYMPSTKYDENINLHSLYGYGNRALLHPIIARSSTVKPISSGMREPIRPSLAGPLLPPLSVLKRDKPASAFRGSKSILPSIEEGQSQASSPMIDGAAILPSTSSSIWPKVPEPVHSPDSIEEVATRIIRPSERYQTNSQSRALDSGYSTDYEPRRTAPFRRWIERQGSNASRPWLDLKLPRPENVRPTAQNGSPESPNSPFFASTITSNTISEGRPVASHTINRTMVRQPLIEEDEEMKDILNGYH